MANQVSHISGADPVSIRWPDNGENTWLKIFYGKGEDQIWIARSAAERLHDALAQALSAVPPGKK
jgi:hypothetical protein